jgi:hypothetical protein
VEPVRIIIRSRGAILRAPVRARIWDVLVAHLSYDENRFSVSGQFGHRQEKLPRHVFARLDRNEYCLPAFAVDLVNYHFTIRKTVLPAQLATEYLLNKHIHASTTWQRQMVESCPGRPSIRIR